MSGTRWAAVWATFAGGLVAGACIGKVPPALPALRTDFGLTLVETGYIATLLNVTGGAAGLFAGIVSDRFGHRRVALAGLAVMAGGSLLGALAPSYAALLASRFLEGVGFILTTVSGVALVAHAAAAADRPKAMALWSCYMPAGGSLAMLAASITLALLSWRSLWLALAAAATACLVLLARSVPAPPAVQRLRASRLGLEALTDPASLLLCLVFAGYVAQWAALITWLPTFIVGERNRGLLGATLFTALWVGTNVPGVLLGGFLIARGVRRSRIIQFASVIQAAAVCGALLDPLPDWMRFASCLAFSFFGGIIPAAVFSGVAAFAPTPRHIGTTNGMVMQTSQLVQFLSPIAVAWIVTRFGWSATLPLMLVFAACAAAGGLAIARIERSRMAS